MNTCTHIQYIFPTWDYVLMYFNTSHLGHRGMTSLEEMSACLWLLIVQMPQFDANACHSHPFGFPAVFPAGSLGLIAVPEEFYQSSYDFTVQSLPVSIQPLRQAMRAHYWIQFQKSFIKPIHTCVHTDREIQRHTKTHKQNHSPPHPCLPPAQTHSSTISSQGDCTHSNKQRRQLLSECNYLVLSISLTAVGQRAPC